MKRLLKTCGHKEAHTVKMLKELCKGACVREVRVDVEGMKGQTVRESETKFGRSSTLGSLFMTQVQSKGRESAWP